MKTEWGVAKFIDQKTFENPSNGFLLNDKCTYGAEVFIIQNTIKGERLTVLEKNDEFTCEFKWKFENVFSTKSDDEWLQSDFFVCGDCRWYVGIANQIISFHFNLYYFLFSFYLVF